jgi:hypothetical protein
MDAFFYNATDSSTYFLYASSESRSQDYFYSMIQFSTERLNKHNHWPPGSYYHPGTNPWMRSFTMPLISVRTFLIHPQTRDPKITFIL